MIYCMTLNKHEPDPKSGSGQEVWRLVINDMIERNNIGTEKYGTPLMTFNGRNALIDAYQEALDLCVYLRQAITESIKEI